MNEYTQGEWEVESSDCMTAHYVLVNAYDYFEDGYLSDDPQTQIALRKEDKANARLIAAAPDLLAACEAQEEADNWFGSSSTGRKLKNWAKRLRETATKKAK